MGILCTPTGGLIMSVSEKWMQPQRLSYYVNPDSERKIYAVSFVNPQFYRFTDLCVHIYVCTCACACV